MLADYQLIINLNHQQYANLNLQWVKLLMGPTIRAIVAFNAVIINIYNKVF
jgi:hypothetical protein